MTSYLLSVGGHISDGTHGDNIHLPPHPNICISTFAHLWAMDPWSYFNFTWSHFPANLSRLPKRMKKEQSQLVNRTLVSSIPWRGRHHYTTKDCLNYFCLLYHGKSIDWKLRQPRKLAKQFKLGKKTSFVWVKVEVFPKWYPGTCQPCKIP